MRSFIEVTDLSAAGIGAVLDRADELRAAWRSGAMPRPLAGKKVALWFWGQGFRNRVAFEIGARAMGADVSFIPGDLGVHEPIEDVGHYLKNWFDLVVCRAASHAQLLRLGRDLSPVPLINARTERNHPCEIMGDLQFIRAERGSLEGLRAVFVGERSNLCGSWFEAARALPIEVTQVAPAAWLPPAAELAALNAGAVGRIAAASDMGALDPGVELVYTDCWPRGGDREAVREAFLPYQVGAAELDRVHPRAFFLPCPPVTRGEEVAAEALLHTKCRDYAAKDCLLHAQNALMELCLRGGE